MDNKEIVVAVVLAYIDQNRESLSIIDYYPFNYEDDSVNMATASNYSN